MYPPIPSSTFLTETSETKSFTPPRLGTTAPVQKTSAPAAKTQAIQKPVQEQKKNNNTTSQLVNNAQKASNNVQKSKTTNKSTVTQKTGVKPVKTTVTQPVKVLNAQNNVQPKSIQTNNKVVAPVVSAVSTKDISSHVPNVAINTDKQMNNPEQNIIDKEVENSKAQAAAKESKSSVSKLETGLKNDNRNNHKKLPIFPIAGALSALGIFILLGVINSIVKSATKIKDSNHAFGSDAKVFSDKNRAAYNNIMNDNSLSWQEKFKRYTQKEEELNNDNASDYSYVTNIGATNSVVVDNGDNTEETKTDKNILQEQIVSNMEHALKQTPSSAVYNAKVKPSLYADEDSIAKKMNSVKLKTFAKNQSVTESNRNLLKSSSLNNELNSGKESRFVRLRKSALSVSRRKSLSSKVNISDLARSNNLYDMPNTKLNSDVAARRNNTNTSTDVTRISANSIKPKLLKGSDKNYTSSSINEYLDILGSPDNKHSVEFLTKPMAAMEQSKNMTLPQGVVSKNLKVNTVNLSGIGLKIRDRYSVDDKTSIYLVDLDGKTSIIGEVNNEVNVIKSFDKIINKPLQVRHDYGNIYICKVGTYKCLVDVSKSKVASLLEI